MDDFATRGAEDEPAPPAATSGDPWAHETHDEKQKR